MLGYESKSIDKLSETSVDAFVLLDLDRTIGDTTQLFQRLVQVVDKKFHISATDFVNAAAREEASGGSFDAGEYLRGVLSAKFEGSERVASCMEEVASELVKGVDRADCVLNPGASALMGRLTLNNLFYGIITYGGEWWQKTKIKACQLDKVPSMIIDTKNKGELIESWYVPRRGYVMPEAFNGGGIPTVSKSVWLVDDKLVSFRGLNPSRARAYWYQPVDVGEVEVPTNVARIKHLEDVPVEDIDRL